MLASALSSALFGVDAYLVEIEVDISHGVPKPTIVGLAEGAVREALDRVRSAIKNSGYEFPRHKITINLAPADTRKEGSAFDLPIALALLAAAGTLKPDLLRQYLVLGELALDGRIKGIKGALPTAILARHRKLTGVVLPRENAAEAAVVGEGVAILPVDSLRDAFEFFEGLREIEPSRGEPGRCLRLGEPLRRGLRRGERTGAGQARAGGRSLGGP